MRSFNEKYIDDFGYVYSKLSKSRKQPCFLLVQLRIKSVKDDVKLQLFDFDEQIS